jgi:hypothetical protein
VAEARNYGNTKNKKSFPVLRLLNADTRGGTYPLSVTPSVTLNYFTYYCAEQEKTRRVGGRCIHTGTSFICKLRFVVHFTHN